MNVWKQKQSNDLAPHFKLQLFMLQNIVNNFVVPKRNETTKIVQQNYCYTDTLAVLPVLPGLPYSKLLFSKTQALYFFQQEIEMVEEDFINEKKSAVR